MININKGTVKETVVLDNSLFRYSQHKYAWAFHPIFAFCFLLVLADDVTKMSCLANGNHGKENHTTWATKNEKGHILGKNHPNLVYLPKTYTQQPKSYLHKN